MFEDVEAAGRAVTAMIAVIQPQIVAGLANVDQILADFRKVADAVPADYTEVKGRLLASLDGFDALVAKGTQVLDDAAQVVAQFKGGVVLQGKP